MFRSRTESDRCLHTQLNTTSQKDARQDAERRRRDAEPEVHSQSFPLACGGVLAGVVGELRAAQELRPGRVKHLQHRLTSLTSRFAERLTTAEPESYGTDGKIRDLQVS